MRTGKREIAGIVISLLLFLVLQGCMFMHFIGDHHGDHHEGMMGHGNKSHEGHEAKGHQEKTAIEIVTLDKEPRIDNQGGLKVEIWFSELTEKGELAFEVKVTYYLPGVSQYALDKWTTLTNDQGAQVQASIWQCIVLTAQNVYGTIYFPARDEAGKPLLDQGVMRLTLRIKGLGGVPERIFQWNGPSRGPK